MSVQHAVASTALGCSWPVPHPSQRVGPDLDQVLHLADAPGPSRLPLRSAPPAPAAPSRSGHTHRSGGKRSEGKKIFQAEAYDADDNARSSRVLVVPGCSTPVYPCLCARLLGSRV